MPGPPPLVTTTSLLPLGIGWLGEETVAHMLAPLCVELSIPQSASSVVTFIIAFSSMTFLHAVVGELAPKTLAIQKAEQVSLLFHLGSGKE